MDYAAYAEWLDYPAAGRARPPLPEAASPVAASLLEDFAAACAAIAPGKLEEIYAAAFDLQPDCTLNLGHHLFGEDWKRSLFLIELKAMFQRHGVDAGAELPDHLCWMLRLLAAAPGDQETLELLTTCLLPGLRALQQKLQDATNPYRALLEALYLGLNDAQTRAMP